MTKRRRERCERALKRLEFQITSGTAFPEHQPRILDEIANIKRNLTGAKKKEEAKAENKEKDEWIIDVFHIKYGYVKQSERRKNKGKSKKKLKKMKTVSFIKSMIAQPGMIQAFKEGRMGLSPKTHMFRLKRKEQWII